MDNERREQWEQAAHAKFDAFLKRVKEELPAEASIADIERVLLKHENSLMSDTFALLVEHPEVFPLETRAKPEGLWGNGKRYSYLRHRWGKVRVGVQRLISREGKQASMLLDGALDHSGWTPQTLQVLSDLAARLPFEEAAVVAANFGVDISKSELERLLSPLAEACREEVCETLERLPEVALVPLMRSRLFVLQADGVRVLEKPQGGSCGGIEIKSVVLYPQEAPSQRLVMADIRSKEELTPAIKGLLQLAGVTPQDALVGLGDGAEWVENLLDTFCDLRITDVYHAAQYLEDVMQAMSWSDERRSAERRRFCRGEIDIHEWLAIHLPDPSVWLTWHEDALNALRYLDTRREHMHYPSFKEQGYPIGSGMIEGLNKSIVASRMKRSGMQWSRAGAARMAAWRALVTSKHPLVSFETIRHRAFPPPSASPPQEQLA